MSDENRYKLFNGLAKLKILSKNKFKYFFPYCNNAHVHCNSVCTIHVGRVNKKIKGSESTMNTKQKDKRGGARAGAGRKAIDDSEKKQQINFYVKKKNVELIRQKINELIKRLDK